MVVYHFNTYLRGGAAAASRRLHDSLLQAGIRSFYFHHPDVQTKIDDSYRKFRHPSSQPTLSQKITNRLNGKFRFRKNFQRNLDFYLNGRPSGHEKFSYSRLPVETPLPVSPEVPDVVHLHWVSELFDYPSFFASIPDDVPIVWTLHDMNPLTGGCHYSWDCENYKSECGNCPQLNDNRSPSDLSHLNWQIKWRSLRNKQLHIVADSYWLEQRSRESALFSGAESFQTIHYGVNAANLFSPKNRSHCRSILSIHEDAFVICFGADVVDARRKGLFKLQESLSQLPDIPKTILVFGNDDGVRHQDNTNLSWRMFGEINHSDLLAMVYSAADVFVIPSLQEAFGQTILEAMACGIPVVGFRVGGIPDAIRSNTGLLAEVASSDDLAEKIRWLYDNPQEREQMGKNARETVVKDFSLELQASKYISLYRRITGKGFGSYL